MGSDSDICSVSLKWKPAMMGVTRMSAIPVVESELPLAIEPACSVVCAFTYCSGTPIAEAKFHCPGPVSQMRVTFAIV
ncbi:hypothetical protein D3C81_1887440 [compost metagenome]